MILLLIVIFFLSLYTSINLIWKMVTSLFIDNETPIKIHTYVPCLLWTLFYFLNLIK
jgi:hypothetical protein